MVHTSHDPLMVAREAADAGQGAGAALIEAGIRDPLHAGRPAEDLAADRSHQTTGLLMVAVTQFVPDEDDPLDLMAHHTDLLAPASYLALSVPTADHKADSAVTHVVGEYGDASAGAADLRQPVGLRRSGSG